MQDFIYLDYNSTTPVNSEVLKVMLPYFSENFGNASSDTHAFGWYAKGAIEKARKQVAKSIGAEDGEIYFTSGATESINAAIKGVVNKYKSKGNHIITIKTEHKAVLDVCESLEKNNLAAVTYIDVDTDGKINFKNLRNAIKEETILICIMLANNETGVINKIKEISDICKAKNIILMSDISQALGKTNVDVNEYGIDIACISSHKIYGPKGAGALFLRRKKPRVSITPLIEGGGQENNIRSGTLNTAAIVGFGLACELAVQNLAKYQKHTFELKNYLLKLLETKDIGFFNNVNHSAQLSNTISGGFEGVKAKNLLKKCPKLAFSLGSACNSNSNEVSHVLKAMHLSKEKIESTFRISLGWNTSKEDIEKTSEILLKAVESLRN
jgi:cysteine desulfurase